MCLVKDFFNLLFPELCGVCDTPLIRNERVICLKCLYDLPRTRFRSYRENPVAQLFWGRIPVENAGSYFQYQKGSRFQVLIHELKYGGRKDIGRELGRLMGIEFRERGICSVEIILPVPLHRSRRKKRGYNQCDPICEGLSKSLEIPYYPDVLYRSENSSSQTDKSRFNRWANVEGIFRVRKPEMLTKKHILLVDDVVTTGSTLEACANAILEIEQTRISIASLAVALKSF